MNLKVKIILVTLIFAVSAFFLGNVLWPDPVDAMTPTSGQLPFFILLAALESILFGLGVSFLIFVPQLAAHVPYKYRPHTILSFLAISWMLLSWWPHDNLHRQNGINTLGLLYIEYGFHVTFMISAAIVGYCFIVLLQDYRKKS